MGLRKMGVLFYFYFEKGFGFNTTMGISSEIFETKG